MRTLLAVQAKLLSLLIYFAATAYGHPAIGATAALAWVAAWSIRRRGVAVPLPFDIALITAFAILAFAAWAASQLPDRFDRILIFAALAFGASASLATGKPWTAEFANAEYGGLSVTALFRAINIRFSAMWAALFGWAALSLALRLSTHWTWAPLILGGVASALLPRHLMRRSLEAKAAGDRRNDWPAPFALGAPPVSAQAGALDVAVVGAGIGGLTAAALLADAGLKVAVFEQHNLPGGFAHNWLRRARGRDPVTGKPLVFRFDSGVHDISGWHDGGQLRALFDRLGISSEMTWMRLDHAYFIDGRRINVPRDWRAYAETLGAAYPDEAKGIRQLFEDVFAVYSAMSSTGRDQGGVLGMPRTIDGLLDLARAFPQAVDWMEESWDAFVARRITGAGARRWINAISGYVTDDTSALSVARMAPIFGYYFSGGHYPVGGSGRMADALVGAIEARGGVIHLKTAVESITSDNGVATGLTVRGHNGAARHVAAGAVVSNADFTLLTGNLIADADAAATLRMQAGDPPPSCSAFGVALGIRGTLDLPAIVHVEASDGIAELVAATSVDRSCAPEGYSTLEILQLLPAGEAQTWFPPNGARDSRALEVYRASKAYRARKREFGDRLIARARLVVPDIDERIVFRAESSPLTYQRYARTALGAIYGVESRRESAAPQRTPLRNLVIAGAATHGPGIEAVAMSGAHAAKALLPGLLTATGRPRALRTDPAAPVNHGDPR